MEKEEYVFRLYFENSEDPIGYTYRDQLMEGAKALIEEGIIVEMSKGVYVRTRISQYTGKRLPEKSLRDVAIYILQKEGIKILPTSYETAYNEGRSTQVPTGQVIGVDRIPKRTFSWNGKTIQYELIQ